LPDQDSVFPLAGPIVGPIVGWVVVCDGGGIGYFWSEWELGLYWMIDILESSKIERLLLVFVSVLVIERLLVFVSVLVMVTSSCIGIRIGD